MGTGWHPTGVRPADTALGFLAQAHRGLSRAFLSPPHPSALRPPPLPALNNREVHFRFQAPHPTPFRRRWRGGGWPPHSLHKPRHDHRQEPLRSYTPVAPEDDNELKAKSLFGAITESAGHDQKLTFPPAPGGLNRAGGWARCPPSTPLREAGGGAVRVQGAARGRPSPWLVTRKGTPSPMRALAPGLPSPGVGSGARFLPSAPHLHETRTSSPPRARTRPREPLQGPGRQRGPSPGWLGPGPAVGAAWPVSAGFRLS